MHPVSGEGKCKNVAIALFFAKMLGQDSCDFTCGFGCTMNLGVGRWSCRFARAARVPGAGDANNPVGGTTERTVGGYANNGMQLDSLADSHLMHGCQERGLGL